MDESTMRMEVLKWMLGQVCRAEDRKHRLERRLARLRAEMDAPLRSVNYDQSACSSGAKSEGAASYVYRMLEIEERINEQKEEITNSVVSVMNLLEHLPQRSDEREVLELRYIDDMSWRRICNEMHLSRARCDALRREGLSKLLESRRVRKLVDAAMPKYKAEQGLIDK